MSTETIPQTVLFPDLFNKPVVATFDQPHASSDGGAILLKAADARYGLIAGLARSLVDERQSGKVRHTLEDLLAQRIFGLACGHPDANDADRLADDPIHKLLLGRDPIAGDPLASQPTISRFENQVGAQELYAMGRELATSVIERHRRRLHGRARTITIDLDPTDDPTHGAQQLTFFNGHYDSWCYLPLLAFVTFNDEVEQYLCAAILRPGNAPATRGARGVLWRLLDLLRQAFPKARFLVRLDGGFATPEIFDRLDAEPGLDYVVAMAENAVLTRCAEATMVEARTQSEASGQTEHVYTEARYAAGTWPHERRVVIKAEVVRLPGREPRDNARFVVTNLRQTPRFVYERVYCARGDIENRIKELHDGLQIGRTSCCRFWANQLRVLLTAAAYVLMQELRLRAARTACARTQVTGLRERLLKLGVHVVVSVRRIVLHLPTSTPDLDAWRHIALALGARTG
ncbi:MAG TPA: IS1380 family transposase [Vicinamibacterales bacterium]|nr:IS1380 family transposase [Vicinamibacterales bacterium]